MLSSAIAVPLVLAAGIMIDLTTINQRKSQLQSALDAAALAVAREGKDISDLDADAIAATFLGDNFDPNFTQLKVVKNGTTFSVSAQTRANLAFGALMGYDDWPIVGASTADIAYATYEVALVLDTTGSMKGGKLTAMKDAVVGLIDTMSLQVDDADKLKFSLVPFASFVNVGSGFGPSFDKKGKQIPGTGADWLDLEGKANIPQVELGAGASRFQMYHNLGQAWPGCVETRYSTSGEDYGTTDAPANQAEAQTLYIPAFSIDEPDTGGYVNSYIKSDAKPKDKGAREKKKRFAKYGIATDAAGNPTGGGLLDLVGGLLKTILIDSSTSSYYGTPKGPGIGCDMQPLTPLTSDYPGLKAKVGALKAAGNTNILEGVGWGWRVLTPGAPFAEGQAMDSGVEKIMIVLTDGSNTLGNTNNDFGSTYSSFGYLVDGRLGLEAGGSAATNKAMNDRTLAACTNAKADGVMVYTIRLEEPNVATGTMLKECASSPDHYFDVPSRSQLDEAFGKIKERIVKIRISS